MDSDHEGLRVGEHRHPRARAGRHHQHHPAIPEATIKWLLSYCLHYTVSSPVVGDVLPRAGRAVADDDVVEGARVAVVPEGGAGGAAQLELVRHRAVLDRAVTLNNCHNS